MFLKRLSAVLVTMVCFGCTAWGAVPETMINTTNNGEESLLMAPLDLSVSLNPVSPKCRNGNDGKIEVSIAGSLKTAPYSYRYQKDGGTLLGPFSSPTANFTITGLTAGEYIVYVTDATTPTNQTGQNTARINNPSELSVSRLSFTSPKCSGETGSISLGCSGGTTPYTFFLLKDGMAYTSNQSGSFSGLAYGTYTAYVEDYSGCSKNYNGYFTIDKIDPISISYSLLSEIKCDNGYASVQITSLPTDAFSITVRNTTNGKTYDKHSSDYIYSNLEAGNYIVTVTRTSCLTDISTASFTIDEFKPIGITATPTSPVTLTCGGANDLTNVQINIAGGNSTRQVRVVFDNNNGISTDDPEATGFYGSSFNFDNISAGNYTIRWYDAKYPSTCYGTLSYVINNPSSPLSWANTPVGISPLCNGGSDGQIQVNVSGGTFPYTYYVDGSASTLTSKSAGTYSVYIKDSKGCSTEEKTVTITQPAQLVVNHNTADDVDVTCPGGNNGEIHLSITGGVKPYFYDIATTATGTNLRTNVSTDSVVGIIALAGNTYDVKVKDNNNCIAPTVSNIFIDEPNAIKIADADFILDTIQCNGDKATLMVKATGGSDPNMTYTLYSGSTVVDTKTSSGVVTFGNLTPASYQLKVQSDLNCPDYLTKNFVVVGRKKLVVTNPSDSIMLKCPGDVPSVTLKISGEAPYVYSIDGSSIQNIPITGDSVTISDGLSQSTAGALNHIIIKDHYGCLKNDIYVKIYEPTPIVVTTPEETNVLCNSKRTGSITVTVSGGTPGYTLTLFNDATSEVAKTYPAPTSGTPVKIPALLSGTYNLRVTDKNGCVVDPYNGIFIDQPDSLVIDEPVFNEIKCYGETTEVYFSVSGGWPVDKTVKITGEGRNMSIASGTSFALKAGNYTITASNKDGCYAKARPLTIAQPDKLILTVDSSKNVSCNGANDAKINFSVTGGTPDFLYGIHGSGTAATPFTGTNVEINTNLLAGSYNLVVKDNNGCQSNVVPVTITEPAIITFDVRVDSVSCFDGSDGKILIENAAGGTNTFKAYLTKSGSSEEQVDFPVVSNLSAGTYSIRLVDANSCTSEIKTLTIFQPEVISISSATITQELSCHNSQDGVITIDAIGGRPYSLQYKITGRGYQASNVFSNLPAGIYEIWVKNSKGNCETKYTSPLQIVNPDEIVITSVDKTDVLCHNDQNGTAKINAKGGTGTLSYYLNNAPASIANNPNNTGQFEGLGELNSTSTTYNYTLTDQNGCTKTGNFVIVNPAELTIKKLDSQNVTCNDKKDGWIELEVTGGTGDYTFKRNEGEAVTNDVEKVTSSTYKLIRLDGTYNYIPVVLDVNNCSKPLEETVTIVNPDLIKIIEPIIWGDKKCYGYTDDVTIIHVKGGTPGYYYSLDNGETYGDLDDSIFTSLQVGNKYPRVKDINGCETPKSEAYMLKEPDKLQAFYKFKGMDCFDDPVKGKITLKIIGGTAPYTLCVDDETFNDKPVKLNKTYLDTTTYIDDKLDLYHEYKFYLKDSNNCHIENIARVNEITDYFADTTFTAPDELILDSIAPHPVFCGNSKAGKIEFWAHGGTAPDNYKNWKLTASLVKKPDVSYVNKEGISIVEGLGVGAYNLVLTDARGCKAKSKIGSISYTDTTSIDSENKAITLTLSSSDSITCNQTQDGSLSITVQNFLENGFLWEAQIWEGDTVKSTRPYTAIEKGHIAADPLFKDGYKDHYVYSVFSQKILEDIGIGLYHITVRDSLTDCPASADTILFSINGDSCPPLNFYNAFDQYTGGDEYNDWKLGGTQNLIYNLKIYSAWGEMVYDSHKENGDQKTAAADKNGIRWNGLDNKQRPVPAGTYIYLLRIGAAPNDTLMNGNVTILRSNGR